MIEVVVVGVVDVIFIVVGRRFMPCELVVDW